MKYCRIADNTSSSLLKTLPEPILKESGVSVFSWPTVLASDWLSRTKKTGNGPSNSPDLSCTSCQ